MFGFLMLALASSISPMIADLDGTFVFHVQNQSPSIVAVHTADYCSSNTSDQQDDDFIIAAGGSAELYCGADTAADPHAITIMKPPHVMCRIHLRDDNSPSVDNVTEEDCSARLGGSPERPLIDIVVR